MNEDSVTYQVNPHSTLRQARGDKWQPIRLSLYFRSEVAFLPLVAAKALLSKDLTDDEACDLFDVINKTMK